MQIYRVRTGEEFIQAVNAISEQTEPGLILLITGGFQIDHAVEIPEGSNITIEAPVDGVSTIWRAPLPDATGRHFIVKGTLNLGHPDYDTPGVQLRAGWVPGSGPRPPYNARISNQKCGGVLVTMNGIFNMYRGSISQNRAVSGGGVCAQDSHPGGSFNFYGGVIERNYAQYGGGVAVINSHFNFGHPSNSDLRQGILRRNTAARFGEDLYQGYPQIPGDVNKDGEVTIEDANMILAHVAGNLDLTPSQIAAGDVDANGRLDLFDATVIARYLEGTWEPGLLRSPLWDELSSERSGRGGGIALLNFATGNYFGGEFEENRSSGAVTVVLNEGTPEEVEAEFSGMGLHIHEDAQFSIRSPFENLNGIINYGEFIIDRGIVFTQSDDAVFVNLGDLINMGPSTIETVPHPPSTLASTSIVGTVSGSGRHINDVFVTIVRADGGSFSISGGGAAANRHTTSTSGRGNFAFHGLANGAYHLFFTKAGYNARASMPIIIAGRGHQMQVTNFNEGIHSRVLIARLTEPLEERPSVLFGSGDIGISFTSSPADNRLWWLFRTTATNENGGVLNNGLTVIAKDFRRITVSTPGTWENLVSLQAITLIRLGVREIQGTIRQQSEIGNIRRGIPGVTVRLLNGITGAIIETATSDAVGEYSFEVPTANQVVQLAYTMNDRNAQMRRATISGTGPGITINVFNFTLGSNNRILFVPLLNSEGGELSTKQGSWVRHGDTEINPVNTNSFFWNLISSSSDSILPVTGFVPQAMVPMQETPSYTNNLAVTPLQFQVTAGLQVRGRVFSTNNPLGETVSGVSIALVNMATGARTDYETSSNGEFTFTPVIAGWYRLVFTKDGYNAQISNAFQVTATQGGTWNCFDFVPVDNPQRQRVLFAPMSWSEGDEYPDAQPIQPGSNPFPNQSIRGRSLLFLNENVSQNALIMPEANHFWHQFYPAEEGEGTLTALPYGFGIVTNEVTDASYISNLAIVSSVLRRGAIRPVFVFEKSIHDDVEYTEAETHIDLNAGFSFVPARRTVRIRMMNGGSGVIRFENINLGANHPWRFTTGGMQLVNGEETYVPWGRFITLNEFDILTFELRPGLEEGNHNLALVFRDTVMDEEGFGRIQIFFRIVDEDFYYPGIIDNEEVNLRMPAQTVSGIVRPSGGTELFEPWAILVDMANGAIQDRQQINAAGVYVFSNVPMDDRRYKVLITDEGTAPVFSNRFVMDDANSRQILDFNLTEASRSSLQIVEDDGALVPLPDGVISHQITGVVMVHLVDAPALPDPMVPVTEIPSNIDISFRRTFGQFLNWGDYILPLTRHEETDVWSAPVAQVLRGVEGRVGIEVTGFVPQNFPVPIDDFVYNGDPVQLATFSRSVSDIPAGTVRGNVFNSTVSDGRPASEAKIGVTVSLINMDDPSVAILTRTTTAPTNPDNDWTYEFTGIPTIRIVNEIEVPIRYRIVFSMVGHRLTITSAFTLIHGRRADIFVFPRSTVGRIAIVHPTRAATNVPPVDMVRAILADNVMLPLTPPSNVVYLTRRITNDMEGGIGNLRLEVGFSRRVRPQDYARRFAFVPIQIGPPPPFITRPSISIGGRLRNKENTENLELEGVDVSIICVSRGRRLNEDSLDTVGIRFDRQTDINGEFSMPGVNALPGIYRAVATKQGCAPSVSEPFEFNTNFPFVHVPFVESPSGEPELNDRILITQILNPDVVLPDSTRIYGAGTLMTPLPGSTTAQRTWSLTWPSVDGAAGGIGNVNIIINPNISTPPTPLDPDHDPTSLAITAADYNAAGILVKDVPLGF